MDEDDSLPTAMEEQLLGQRVADACTLWRERAAAAVAGFDDALLDRLGDGDGGSDGDDDVGNENLEEKLANALMQADAAEEEEKASHAVAIDAADQANDHDSVEHEGNEFEQNSATASVSSKEPL